MTTTPTTTTRTDRPARLDPPQRTAAWSAWAAGQSARAADPALIAEAPDGLLDTTTGGHQ